MQNKIMGDVVFASQYAKETPTGRESWTDAVNRVIDMHVKKYPHLKDEIEDAFTLVKDKRVVPSQRSIQFGGRAIERNNMRIYNCTYSPVDRPRFFSEMLWLLLSGCGTGFSVRHADIDQLPRLITVEQHQERRSYTFKIPDSIEGWALAVQALIDSYFLTDYYDNAVDWEIYFDYSEIRPAGTPISSGGVSPGHGPLEICLNEIRHKLVSRLDKKLRSIDVFDICMSLSAAVLAGGVRRSASICLFDEDDELMMKAKTGEWYVQHPNRAYANISASITTDGNEKLSTLEKIVNLNQQWGEPGVYFTNSPIFGTNPCCEIGLFPYQVQSPSGDTIQNIPLNMSNHKKRLEQIGWMFRSGWGVCNLTEINMAKNKTLDEFYEACAVASFIGTLQAGYTNQGYLTPVTKRIIEQEALIGVSLTGMHANSDLSFASNIIERGAEIVVEENKRVAELIGINYASRTTCIKPSGNTSTVLGTSAGIHPFYSERYIRTIRLNKLNPVWKEIKEKLPQVCIDLEGDTGIVEFACGAPDEDAYTSDEFTAHQHISFVAFIQKHWVLPGSKNSRVEGLTHNVSNTCTVGDDDWAHLPIWLWKHRKSVKGVAMLADYADDVYQNAPKQKVIKGSIKEKRWELLNQVDWDVIDLTSIKGGNDVLLTGACDGMKCELP